MTEIGSLIENTPLSNLVEKYPFLTDYLESLGIPVVTDTSLPLVKHLNSLGDEFLEDKAIDVEETLNGTVSYIEQMLEFLGMSNHRLAEEITILPGKNKSGEPEGFESLTIRRGEIISIVGPTGSGKSRLLADIEWMAQGDTPTGRRILVDSKEPDKKWRFSTSDKLVAQLSQNMNFVMDLTVEEFLTLHAESRLVQNTESVVQTIFEKANELAGEAFTLNTAITALSGGQSRALMIADTAILSKSPIVLIDEIENAGIDRKKALALLISEEKIVLMATHDPLLALMADRRIVIQHGGIHRILETGEDERGVLSEIEALDKKVQNLRAMLRAGESLNHTALNEL